MEIRTSASLAARGQAAIDGIGALCRAATVLALYLAAILQASAAVGDLDVRFGTNGEVAVGDNTGSAVVELPDGRWMIIGSPDPSRLVSRDTIAINRYAAAGVPDESFGPAGRALVTFPLYEISVRAAAAQPDGKLILVGWASRGSGDGVRFVARVTADGLLDAGFGVNGVTIGGWGGWGGYSSVVVLPNGDILAAIGEWDGERRIDRFSANGAPTPGAQLSAVPALMATQADGRVVVIGQQGDNGVAWRLLPDGSLDTGFGNGGYAALFDRFPSRVALDPVGQRIAICSSLGVQQFTSDGRADAAFGPRDGLVSFDSQGLPKVSRCEGLLVNADGSVVVGASDVQGTEAVLHHAYVIGLRPDGSPDFRFDGRGYVEVRTGSAPGSRWVGIELRRTRDQNALFAWTRQEEGRTEAVVDRIDLGQDMSAGAVGVPLSGVRVMESAGRYLLKIVRSGSPQGAAGVRIETRSGSAASGDFSATGQDLTWSDGDAGSKFVELPIVDDGVFEGEESFEVRLLDARGVRVASDVVTVTIVDDDALRALRILDEEIVVRSGATTGPSMRVSRDDQGAGPVTAYYYVTNGIDSCCVGRLSWAAGERGTKEVSLPGPVGNLSRGYSVGLVDENWRSLDLDALVKVTGSAASTPTPTPPNPVAGGSGNGGGGALTMLELALFGLGLAVAACARRRNVAVSRLRPIGWPPRSTGQRAGRQGDVDRQHEAPAHRARS